MQIIPPDKLELIRKADEGCVSSQLSIGLYYRKLTPSDDDMSAHYLGKVLEIPYHTLKAKGHLDTPEHYLLLIIKCGHSIAVNGDFEKALEHYDRAAKFADEHIPKEEHEALFDKVDFIESKELLEEQVSLGFTTYDRRMNFNG